MSDAKRIAIHVSEQMHDDLLAIAEMQGVTLSKLSWAWLFEKYTEPGTQQMLERIREAPPNPSGKKPPPPASDEGD